MPTEATERWGPARKPRVLVTTTTLPRSEADPEPRFVIDLARHLQDRFDVTVLAPSFPGARSREWLFGIEVLRYRYAPLRAWERLAYPGAIMSRLRAKPLTGLLVPGLILGQALALRRIVRSRRIDLIHAHWTLPQGLVAATLPRHVRVPYVATAHGGDVYTLGQGRLRPALRLVLRRAAAVTAVSKELHRTLTSVADNADVSSRIHWIPMGVDARRFTRAAAGAERPDDIPQQGPTILFVGRLAEKKGVRVLIDAVAAGPPALDTARVVIVGDGPLKAELVARAAERGVGDRVSFVGARAHDRLPAYLASADVLALPSVPAPSGDKDGLPVVLMEAAACGLPVVASAIGGVPEFVVHGVNGLLVPPDRPGDLAAALAAVLRSSTRDALASGARAAATAFGWPAIAERFAAVFSAALEGTVARPAPVALLAPPDRPPLTGLDPAPPLGGE